ncbi:MAG: hypothetical protein JSS83_17430 [Cyanobacteria bacterium SZAS LIN-3]|nr:hypothetical protein [Cyanobacteria bacterium SZAS LIN-3]
MHVVNESGNLLHNTSLDGEDSVDQSTIVNLIIGIVGVFGTLGGVAITLWFTAHQEERKRQLARLEKTIDDFLAPVMALRHQAEHLEKIIAITTSAAEEKKKLDPEKDDFDVFKSIHFYMTESDDRWERCYEEIHTLIRDKGHLAEEVTGEDYRKTLEMVEFLRWRKNEHYKSEAVIPIAPDRKLLDAFFSKVERGLKARQDILRTGKLMRKEDGFSLSLPPVQQGEAIEDDATQGERPKEETE